MLKTVPRADLIAQAKKGAQRSILSDPLTAIVAAHVLAVGTLLLGLLVGVRQLYLVSGALLAGAVILLLASSYRSWGARAAAVEDIDLPLGARASPSKGALSKAVASIANTPPCSEVALQHDLTDALANGELRLVYQPLARLSSGRTIGYEALLRWDHPQFGLILPTRFIEAAETSGLIVPVGAWVMQAACQEAARWDKTLFVSVNTSAVQIAAPGFADMVRAALTECGLSPARLEIEVTETALLDDNSTAREALRDLRAMGVRIALDDFGMGHASFSYLLTFPFDKIKIDRKFIADIAWRPESRTIVEAVTGMAHKLGIEVLAEGIEEVDQLVIAKLAGCELGQGLLLGEPRPAEEHYRLRPTQPPAPRRKLAVAA